ncbi:MAG TPA: GntR family transcriptional regulator [Candidatus Avamphibacillus sp.]|nr:GntR family transcriptional regulator [Candidatus Avamphibacillus sp.]
MNNISKIKSAKKAPLSYIVYENIKHAIIKGELKPGTRLIEAELSEQLNVSATPIREAFSRLLSEGLIKMTPYRGTIVQEFSFQEISDVYECREALELKAIDLSINKIKNEEIEELKYLLEKSAFTSTHTEYVKINSRIHDVILNCANNKLLNGFMKQIREVIIHNRNVSSYSEERKNEIYKEHKKIINAIERKSKESAKTYMKEHIQNGYNYIQKYI